MTKKQMRSLQSFNTKKHCNQYVRQTFVLKTHSKVVREILNTICSFPKKVLECVSVLVSIKKSKFGFFGILAFESGSSATI